MWLADKCSSVKKPAHNGLFLVQKYKIQLLYSLNCQTKTINCYYKFSTSKCVKSHIHEWINRIHIYWIFIIIIRYHVFCIYDFYVFDIWKKNRKCCCSSNVLDCGDDIAKLKLHFECTCLLQVMQPFLTYSLKISCSYCHDFKCFVIWRVLGLKNPGYLYHHKNMKYDMYWGGAVLYFSMKFHFQLWMALDTEEKLSDLRWSPLTSPSIK